MSYPLFDRNCLKFKPLAERQSKINTSVMVDMAAPLPELSPETGKRIKALADRIKKARQNNGPVILAYGAHLFRNGLSPLIIEMVEKGYIQQLITNGAGVIHDWEMSYQGKTTEDVSAYMSKGQFGIWEETGLFLNLSIAAGAAEGLGYGEAVGKMINDDFLRIPDGQALCDEICFELSQPKRTNTYLSKVIFFELIERLKLKQGQIEVKHPHKQYSLIYNAYRNKVPFSVCPGIGYDIMFSHPANSGAAVGQGALWDFLAFVNTVANMENGVYLSIGSAVMSPMVFEKALSMARNVACQGNKKLENFEIAVVDIQPGSWDWKQGEPPKSNPAYYSRFCKSFSRMGGNFSYFEMQNDLFIRWLSAYLKDGQELHCV